MVNYFKSLCGNGDGVLFALPSNYRCGRTPLIGSLSLPRPELTAGAPLSFFRQWRGGTTVLYAVRLEHNCDGRKVDLGLKCWRWGRADDNELTFWELRLFVHALFRWEQKHVLPSRVIKRSRTEWANLFRSLGWFWDDVFIESSQHCRAIEGAVQIQVRAEFAVQTKAALAILVQWVVLRHRKRARTTARAMLCGILKCCCTVESIACRSFQAWVLAASTHCQTAPTYNGKCACLKDLLARLNRVQQMEAHPKITAMLATLFEDRECLAVRSIFVDLVESLSLAVERLRVGHEERSNCANSSQQWQSPSAFV